MKRKLYFILLIGPLAFGVIHAQSPMVVVQAASPAPAANATTTTTTTAIATDAAGTASLIKLLQEMRAANAETLKKQEAVLQQLDEIKKAAEQIKAFSSRS